MLTNVRYSLAAAHETIQTEFTKLTTHFKTNGYDIIRTSVIEHRDDTGDVCSLKGCLIAKANDRHQKSYVTELLVSDQGQTVPDASCAVLFLMFPDISK